MISPVTNPARTQAASRTFALDGSKVLARRAELGLLQKEVARRAGISPQMLADIEAGRRNGSVPTRARLARALRTNLAALAIEDA